MHIGNVVIVHDVCPCVVCIVLDMLCSMCWTVLDHPSYKLDLSPCDLCLLSLPYVCSKGQWILVGWRHQGHGAAVPGAVWGFLMSENCNYRFYLISNKIIFPKTFCIENGRLSCNWVNTFTRQCESCDEKKFFLKSQMSTLPDCRYNIRISSCDFHYKEHENEDMLVMTKLRKWLWYFRGRSVTVHNDR